MKKIFFGMIITLLITSQAYAEVFMYQDEKGKWYGVNSVDQIPERYRSQEQSDIAHEQKEKEKLKQENHEISPQKLAVLTERRRLRLDFLRDAAAPADVVVFLMKLPKDEFQEMDFSEISQWLNKINESKTIVNSDPKYTQEDKKELLDRFVYLEKIFSDLVSSKKARG